VDGIRSSEERAHPVARTLVGLLLNAAAALIIAFLFANPAYKFVALFGFVILLVVMIARLGVMIAILGALLDILLFACIFHGRWEVYGWLVQLFQDTLARWL
jgi:K+-sensing histidine kinase KdpD